MLLFLLAAGLSLIFGLMRILNLAHGSYYLLGAYVALSVVEMTGSLVVATLVGIAVVVALGVVMERVCLRRLPRHEVLPLALCTWASWRAPCSACTRVPTSSFSYSRSSS